MIWATVSSWSCFCWLYRASLSLGGKNIISLILVLTIWWCPCVDLLLCCWKRVFAMTSAFSWQNSISLFPASFYTPRPNLPATPGISWFPNFALHYPIFPVVMYGCESCTVKKAECWRIDAFELWCWRRLLRVPWTARRSNQSILKEISPGMSLEGMMLKLKLQYFGHAKSWLIGKDSDAGRAWAGGEGDDRGWDGWMASLTRWTWVWVNSGSWWWTGRPGVLRFMGSQRVGHDWATELNWLKEALKGKYVH